MDKRLNKSALIITISINLLICPAFVKCMMNKTFKKFQFSIFRMQYIIYYILINNIGHVVIHKTKRKLNKEKNFIRKSFSNSNGKLII